MKILDAWIMDKGTPLCCSASNDITTWFIKRTIFFYDSSNS